MLIHENMKVVESSIEVYGNMQVIAFQTSHKLDHSNPIVWQSMAEFCQIMATYSSEQKFDLKYSRKTFKSEHLRKTTGNNMTKDHNNCHLGSLFVA